MPRYIDADALSNFANNQVGGITANHIMRFPAADVGSICGEQENVDIHNDNFCPNCGAKMDKEG
jgi:hypothetical protein